MWRDILLNQSLAIITINKFKSLHVTREITSLTSEKYVTSVSQMARLDYIQKMHFPQARIQHKKRQIRWQQLLHQYF